MASGKLKQSKFHDVGLPDAKSSDCSCQFSYFGLSIPLYNDDEFIESTISEVRKTSDGDDSAGDGSAADDTYCNLFLVNECQPILMFFLLSR